MLECACVTVQVLLHECASNPRAKCCVSCICMRLCAWGCVGVCVCIDLYACMCMCVRAFV